MKMTFEKEMFLLNGVIDLWYVETFTEKKAWLELKLHSIWLKYIEGQ